MKALRRKVLVVDDDPVIGRSFDRVLSESGYEVSTAPDGPQALARIGREDYDVVFTDIKMPGMDGLEVAERIREARPWVPVVIITGYGTPANAARAEAAGVAGFLNKPLSPETIERSTRAALRVIEGGAGKSLLAPPAAPLSAVEPAPEAVPAATGTAPAESRAVTFLKNAGLFFAAPFVGLAYVIAFPFIGVGLLLWHAAKALNKRSARE